jgi:hypothetical protein
MVARAKIKPATESVWDERIISLIVAQNTSEDKFFREHLIPVRELTGGEPLSNSQYKEVQDAINERILNQTYILPDGKKGSDGYPIFERIKIDDEGNITAKLNQALCEHFLELKKEFAVRSYPAFSTLSSTYAQALFRVLNSWKNMAEATIKLDALHEMLSTPPSFRKSFQSFRRRVLDIAQREITNPNKTNFFFAWEPVKKGKRKVESIRFIFVESRVETPEEKALREHGELQKASRECWQVWERQGKKGKCSPKKRSPKCQFCTTRGMMRVAEMQQEERRQEAQGEKMNAVNPISELPPEMPPQQNEIKQDNGAKFDAPMPESPQEQVAEMDKTVRRLQAKLDSFPAMRELPPARPPQWHDEVGLDEGV